LIQISESSSFNSIEAYLSAKGWLKENEHIAKINKAGEGNMNVVLRVTTNLRSLILKQSRPYVQKYQNIPAPLDRISVEKAFYEAVQNGAIKQHFPTILGFDAASYLLALEDLGDCEDMSFIYDRRSITDHQMLLLVSIIKNIHATAPPSDFPDNLEMRQLNHQHIFILPFLEDNGFSLDDVQPGLQKISLPFKKDIVLKMEISKISDTYLSKGNTLLHGDYYPGSWMIKDESLYIIDPEFGFVGFAEFDIGVLAAHVIMASHDVTYLKKIEKLYGNFIDTTLTKKIAGIEMMRRLIGLAQLPFTRTLDEKQQLLLLSKNLILS
jgi:5-methylthioribose kinase